MTEPVSVVVVGAGGHARVIIDILIAGRRFRPVALTDPVPDLRGTKVDGIPVVGGDECWARLLADGVQTAIVAVGDNALRSKLAKKITEGGFELCNAIHPSATIAPNAKMGKGIAVMAHAVVNPGASIGDNVIINTSAVVEHDCIVAEGAHIAPGATLGGRVQVGEEALVGLGACVLPGCKIGRHAVVGAGSVVIRAVPDGGVQAGVPARTIRKS